MVPHDITDSQRLLSGMYELTNGQVFKASLFGRIEKGMVLSQCNLETISMCFLQKIILTGKPAAHLTVELNVVHAIFRYHRAKAAAAGNTSPDTPAYIAIVNTITTRFMCE